MSIASVTIRVSDGEKKEQVDDPNRVIRCDRSDRIAGGGSTEGESTEGGSTEGESTEGGSTEGGNTEGGKEEVHSAKESRPL